MSGKPAIPEWQRASADNAAASPEPEEAHAQHAVEAPTPTEDDLERDDREEQPSQGSELLEQASRFLEDETIRDAPREKKVVFLQSKGVNTEDIEALLGTEPQEDTHAELEEVAGRAWSKVSLQPPRSKRMEPRLSIASQRKDINIHRRRQSPQMYKKQHFRHAKPHHHLHHAKYPQSLPTQSSLRTPKSHHRS
jgi:hypothetical protein